MERVHSFGPVLWPDSRVLVLGTVPSPKSRENQINYGNPRNRFWPVLAALWDETDPKTSEGRHELLRRRHVALWDVLESCEIKGASDASISDPVPNDIARVLALAPICAVFTTGSTATKLYRRLCEPACGVPCTGLPSTSPANAAWTFEKLVEAYLPVRHAADSTLTL
ncbi:MAG: DNA-deoxyinosine glycosylase [Atopobiaceae bacterium]|nr:DNA-deoxyinosine glycosylase [Atopobiaceae bacterium]